MSRWSAATSTFNAVADPTRRAILQLLREREQSVSELMAPFEVSQSAISQHLRVLREAGLVADRQEGRLRLYRLNAEPLKEIADWVQHFEEFWPERLQRLRAFLDQENT
jgi:DNA-binding transcriptional ArsR family regulator